MKIALIAPLAFVLVAAVPQATIHAQPYQGPSITIPLPGQEHREGWRDDHDRRCAELGNRDRELRERLQRVSYGEEREHLEHEFRETQERLRDECRR